MKQLKTYHEVRETKESRGMFLSEKYKYLHKTFRSKEPKERDYPFVIRYINEQRCLDRRYRLELNELTKQRFIVFDDWDYFQVLY